MRVYVRACVRACVSACKNLTLYMCSRETCRIANNIMFYTTSNSIVTDALNPNSELSVTESIVTIMTVNALSSATLLWTQSGATLCRLQIYRQMNCHLPTAC